LKNDINIKEMAILKNLYLLKSLGYRYIDFSLEYQNSQTDIIDNDITSLQKRIKNCHLCDFSKSRKQSMTGFGSYNADLMIVDFMVSEIEDNENGYFKGRNGKMLKDMIKNVLELDINDIFYTHIIKCKPLSKNSDFEKAALACKSYLYSQIKLIKPKIIVTLGENAYYYLTNEKQGFENVRGHIIELKDYKLVPIYHPLFILRNPNLKKIVYQDLKTIKSCL
jgi:DNA polymerase